MASTPDIDQVIAKTQSQIARLEAMEKSGMTSQPLLKRMSGHLAKNGNFLVPMLMAGCVFSVAWTQLQQKYKYQQEISTRDDQLKTLRAERQGLLDSLSQLEAKNRNIRHGIIQELDTGGYRLAPTAKRLRELLSLDSQTEFEHGVSVPEPVEFDARVTPPEQRTRLMI